MAETKNSNQTRSLAELIALEAWHKPFSDKVSQANP